MNNKSSFLKKSIIGAILSLILCFGLWIQAPKVKAAEIPLNIVDLNDLKGLTIKYKYNFNYSYSGDYYVVKSSVGEMGFVNDTTRFYNFFYVNSNSFNMFLGSGRYYTLHIDDVIKFTNTNDNYTLDHPTRGTHVDNLSAEYTDFLDAINNSFVRIATVETSTINFYGWDGTIYTTRDLIRNEANLMDFPHSEREGYNFLGWSFTQNAITPDIRYGTEWTPTQSAYNLYEVWQANNVAIVSFNGNGGTGTAPPSEQVLIGTSYTLPYNTFTKTNYDFVGWSTNSSANWNDSGVHDQNTSVEILSDTIFYAIWRISQKTLTLNLQGGNIPGGISQYTYDYNTQVNLNTLNTPVKVGFIFLGWGLTSDATEFISTITMSSNKTIYAIWGTSTQDLATITFNGNGNTSGATPGTIRVIKGQQYTLPSNPGELEKTGYTFIGWGLTSDATTPVLTITPSADMTLYAIWNELNYATITLQVNGNNVGVCKLYNGVLPTFYIRFNEFNDDYFYIRITANDGVNYSQVDYNYIWNIIYNYTERNGKVLYTFNGNKVEKIIITNALGEETEYDQASIDLAHYSLLYYYNNNDTYTINILTEPNTDIDSFKNIIKNIFDGTQHLLNLKIGWFTLGGLVAIVLGVGVLFFVIKIGKGGGN